MNQNGKYLLDTNILIAMLADDMIIHTPDEMQNVPNAHFDEIESLQTERW